jgi:ubiquinone/menaquinone biosynthesis C-methylase UbiE
MANMNAPEGEVDFVPKQALPPAAQLYDELVSDGMENLAKASLALIPRIAAGSTINDNGCGTGAATAAVVAALKGSSAGVTVKGTDINEHALAIYRSRAEKGGWPAEGVNMDSYRLRFAAGTFDLIVGNALLFVLPHGDGVGAVREAYRTLKPGGRAIFNSWAHVPNMPPLEAAARETRPEGSPLPRAGLEKWADPNLLRQIMWYGGFE